MNSSRSKIKYILFFYYKFLKYTSLIQHVCIPYKTLAYIRYIGLIIIQFIKQVTVTSCAVGMAKT